MLKHGVLTLKIMINPNLEKNTHTGWRAKQTAINAIKSRCNCLHSGLRMDFKVKSIKCLSSIDLPCVMAEPLAIAGRRRNIQKAFATATKSKILTIPSPLTSGASVPNPLATATKSRMLTVPSPLTSAGVPSRLR